MGPFCHTQVPTGRTHVGPWGSTGVPSSRERSLQTFQWPAPPLHLGVSLEQMHPWHSWDTCWASGDLLLCPHNSSSPTPVPGCTPSSAPDKVGCQHPQGICPPRVPRCRCCNAQKLACPCRSMCLTTARLSHKCECPHRHPGTGAHPGWPRDGRDVSCLCTPVWGQEREPQRAGRGWPPPCVPSLALQC